jgi:hypothetical protein
MDGICHKLTIRVGVAAEEGCLSTFFDLAKEEFTSIGSQVRDVEHCVVCLNDCRCRLAIDGAQLVQDVNDSHAGVPTLDREVI